MRERVVIFFFFFWIKTFEFLVFRKWYIGTNFDQTKNNYSLRVSKFFLSFSLIYSKVYTRYVKRQQDFLLFKQRFNLLSKSRNGNKDTSDWSTNHEHGHAFMHSANVYYTNIDSTLRLIEYSFEEAHWMYTVSNTRSVQFLSWNSASPSF